MSKVHITEMFKEKFNSYTSLNFKVKELFYVSLCMTFITFQLLFIEAKLLRLEKEEERKLLLVHYLYRLEYVTNDWLSG